MSSTFRQTQVMLRANLLSLPRRLAVSLSMTLSVALVVCVLAGFLAMAAGFEQTLKATGSPTVAVVLGGGSNQETGSDIPPETLRSIMALGGPVGVRRDAGGNLLASREVIVPAAVGPMSADHRAEESGTVLALRGMDLAGPKVRDGVDLSAGRLFTPGTHEIVVGAGLAQRISGFDLGKRVRLGALDWTVVGHFSAHGGAFESEIWADLDSVRAGFDRQGEVQSLRLRLESPAGLAALQAALARLTTAPLVAVSEADLYAGQSGRTADLIRLFGWPLALLMAVGATAGALNTMMSSVADRSVEIATLRALGFNRTAAFCATWTEAAVLALVGVAVGIALSWGIFNGWQASTLGANNAQMGFSLQVTGRVMLTSGILGLAIGLLGGALPALAATRLPLTAALRAAA
ncbi:ABC transporter permease [Phaeovulum sp. W22_SRMD_FR3]|uniref:ABC transporter permease n=1 Tax=Phaeovulum sp. W22_SRMD_FR3 TaxID=3240274 RepID=UPI003F973DE3